jgi:hypothetical protein
MHSSTMIATETRARREDSEVGREAPAGPAVLLIPEARQLQKSRYRRTLVVALLSAAVLGAVLAAARSGLGWGRQAPAPASGTGAAASTGSSVPVLVRPVLCFARPADPGARPSPLPGDCPAASAATAAAIGARPQAGGSYDVHIVPDDPALLRIASTTGRRDAATRVVLLPFADARRGRVLLGPAALRLTRSAVRAVHVTPGPPGAWTLSIDLTPRASAQLDRVARSYFHTYVALDLGGKVVGDPVMEGTRPAFGSLGGHLDLVGRLTGGGLSGPLARRVASDLRS